ncbi:MAG: hypothetical protein JXX28_16675 [Deltaproteobacteria bacterium]|nr:hypothetical protein [Deltaproteobacteria bacterium]
MDQAVATEELLALARAVSMDAGVSLEVGQAGGGWFYNRTVNGIFVDPTDLTRRHPDDLRGLTCHEAAHVAVTRYLELVPQDLLQRPGIGALFNALEDCRIEAWLQLRFPGTIPWIARYNDRLFPSAGASLRGLPLVGRWLGRDQGSLAGQPWMAQFTLGAIYEWWHGVPNPTVAPRPALALERTREARQAVIAQRPPTSAEITLDDLVRYRASPVHTLYAPQDAHLPPDALEQLIRVSAYEAYRLLWTGVVPEYLALLRASAGSDRDRQREESRLLEQLGEHRAAGRRGRAPTRDSAPQGGEPSVTELDDETRRALDDAIAPPPTDSYEAAARDVAPLADRTVAALERVLRPASYPQWLPGYPNGSRVDLRVAMRVEIDAGAYTQMWQRKTLPTKHDPAFLLLLDLSGSMDGDRIRHGFRGVVLLAEVLERLQIPFAVYGFQDRLIPFKDPQTPLDPTTKARIGEMPREVTGTRPQGHNHPQHNWDATALLRAARALQDFPASDHYLIAVSDGQPTGPSPDPSAQLHKAVRSVMADGVHLVGMGLGPETGHVRAYYPHHAANVPLHAFPETLMGVLEPLIAPSR